MYNPGLSSKEAGMLERQRIIRIYLLAKLVGDISIAELARAGNVDAQIAVYEGFQGNMGEVIKATFSALAAANLSFMEFLENEMRLVNEVPLGGDTSDVVFHC